jgi:hypothetical protein
LLAIRFHHQACQPTRNCPDDQPRDPSHLFHDLDFLIVIFVTTFIISIEFMLWQNIRLGGSYFVILQDDLLPLPGFFAHQTGSVVMA